MKRLLALGALGVAACGGSGEPDTTDEVAPADAPPPWFAEEAAARGIDFVHESGHADRYYFPELMGGGVALLDVDGDGDLDAFCVQSGSLIDTRRSGHRLYRNDGTGRFTDVTAESGITPGGYGMGVATGDYDDDGDVDLYITCVGANRLLRNDGTGRFEDVTQAAGVGDEGWGTSATFLDFDVDGVLDLFVANYVDWSLATEKDCFDPTGEPDYCGPTAYAAPSRDVLYRGSGDGTFTDVTVAMGLDAAYGNGLGAVAGDFDGDGLPDLFVANDQTPDNLWLRGPDGKMVDLAERRGVARSPHGGVRAGMGVDAADVDGDADLDLLVVHMAREQDGFFRNRGDLFVEETRRVGIGVGTFTRTRFGVGFHDFDADGWLDLFVANGRVNMMMAPLDAAAPYDEPNSLLRGTPDGKWTPVEPEGGTAESLVATSRGAAFGDVDGDGRVDVLIVNRDGRAHLLMNRVPETGRSLIVRAVEGERDSIGAIVSLDVGGRTQVRSVKSGYSYCSASDLRVHFGMADATTSGPVRVRWPDGDEDSFGPFDLEGASTSVVVRRR